MFYVCTQALHRRRYYEEKEREHLVSKATGINSTELNWNSSVQFSSVYFRRLYIETLCSHSRTKYTI